MIMYERTDQSTVPDSLAAADLKLDKKDGEGAFTESQKLKRINHAMQ